MNKHLGTELGWGLRGGGDGGRSIDSEADARPVDSTQQGLPPPLRQPATHTRAANGLRKRRHGLSHKHTMIASDCDRVNKWCCDVSQRNAINGIMVWDCDIIAGYGTATSSQTHAYMFFKHPSQHTLPPTFNPIVGWTHTLYTRRAFAICPCENTRGAKYERTFICNGFLPTCKHYNLPSSTCTCCIPGAAFLLFSAPLPDPNDGGPQHGNAQ